MSILLIFLSHLRSSVLNEWYYYVLQNATVFFLFISGFLFQYLFQPGESTPAFWLKKLQRLVLPYLVASLVGYSIHFFTGGGAISWGDVGIQLITGSPPWNVGYWYIPAILAIFLTHPLLRILAVRKTPLAWVTGFFLLVSLVTFRSAGNANPWINAIHFYGVFLLGMSASSRWPEVESFLRRRKNPVVILGSLLFLVLLQLTPLSAVKDMEGVITQGTWGVNWSLLSRLAIIPVILTILIILQDQGRRLRYLSVTGKMSFGIFFYHGYLIHVVNSDWVNSFLPQNNLGVFLINIIFVLGVLWGGLSLIHKLMGKKSAFLTGY